jgi:hypothetical protein
MPQDSLEIHDPGWSWRKSQKRREARDSDSFAKMWMSALRGILVHRDPFPLHEEGLEVPRHEEKVDKKVEARYALALMLAYKPLG